MLRTRYTNELISVQTEAVVRAVSQEAHNQLSTADDNAYNDSAIWQCSVVTVDLLSLSLTQLNPNHPFTY